MIVAGNQSRSQVQFSAYVNIPVFNAIIQFSNAKGSELGLLLALSKFADNKGVCWMGVKTMAKLAHCCERTAVNLKNKLIAQGELKVIGRHVECKTDILQILCVAKAQRPSVSEVKHAAPVGEKPNTCQVKGFAPKQERVISQVKSVPDPIPEKSREKQVSVDTSNIGTALTKPPSSKAPHYPAFYFEDRVYTPGRLKMILLDIDLTGAPYPPPNSPLYHQLARARWR